MASAMTRNMMDLLCETFEAAGLMPLGSVADNWRSWISGGGRTRSIMLCLGDTVVGEPTQMSAVYNGDIREDVTTLGERQFVQARPAFVELEIEGYMDISGMSDMPGRAMMVGQGTSLLRFVHRTDTRSFTVEGQAFVTHYQINSAMGNVTQYSLKVRPVGQMETMRGRLIEEDEVGCELAFCLKPLGHEGEHSR